MIDLLLKLFEFAVTHIKWITLFVLLLCLFSVFFFKKKIVLTPELIPYPMHGKNVRAVLSPYQWRKLSELVREQAGNKCDICGSKKKLECHEVWEFNEFKSVQKLVGLSSLCSMCHKVKHIGLSRRMGYFNHCVSHMSKVNKTSRSTSLAIIRKCEQMVKKRNREYWLDLTYLNQYRSFLPRRFTSRENEFCRKIDRNE